MSEPYEIVSFVPAGLDPWTAVSRVDEILRGAELAVDEDSQLLLNDTATLEPDPQTVVNPLGALRHLASWPTLGAIEYAALEGPVTVSYHSDRDPPRVQCVLLSAGQRAVDHRAGVDRYRQLAASLHAALGATRTVMAWGLTAGGFSWSDEVVRLLNGHYESSYPLLDLRRNPG